MLNIRVIPCLLLHGGGLVKTVRFKDPKYVGDPINAIKIFNEKEVDELILLDIGASAEGRGPSFSVIEDIASECFMPVAYGGGIRDIDDMRRILRSGVEKVVVNSAALRDPGLIRSAAKEFGSQAIVVSLDVKRKLFGRYEIHADRATRPTGLEPLDFARQMQDAGAGEIFLTAIDRDGTMSGYDLELLAKVSHAVSIPVVACGGAGSVNDMRAAVRQGGASAVAAGSVFVFHGRHRAVLISYPDAQSLQSIVR
ncbi:cyclase [Burkholderiales bacterium]|nr:cyclase [Burkholderiales bacterium]